MGDVAFIAVDWGTSSFRMWALGVDGTIGAFSSGPFGMANLKRSDFGNVLEDSIAKMGLSADVPVVICGMAGVAQGWCEAPYLQTPTPLHALGKGAVSVRGSTRDVRILPGIKQLSPANVMRGEETQIAGLLHHEPGFSGTVCLPGTHTKWVRVADKTVLDFETCMTGEQFAFFSETSVLSHSMAGAIPRSPMLLAWPWILRRPYLVCYFQSGRKCSSRSNPRLKPVLTCQGY